jgi:hypothetical protein
VFSLVRGPWELRLARVDDLSAGTDPAELRLRVGGWAVAGAGTGAASAGSATATGESLISRLTHIPVGGAPGDVSAGISVHDDAGPLGAPVRVAWLDHVLDIGTWTATLVELSAGEAEADECQVVLDAANVRIGWPDGVHTHTHIDLT